MSVMGIKPTVTVSLAGCHKRRIVGRSQPWQPLQAGMPEALIPCLMIQN